MVFPRFPATVMNIKYFSAADFLVFALFSFLSPPSPSSSSVGREEGVGPGTDVAVESVAGPVLRGRKLPASDSIANPSTLAAKCPSIESSGNEVSWLSD